MVQNLHYPAENMHILPAGFRKEGFAWPGLNRPEGNRKPYPVQTSPGDLRDILFRLPKVLVPYVNQVQNPTTHDEGVVMIF